MRIKMLALIALGCFCTAAQAMPIQGYTTIVGGRAHVQKEADGTYIYFNGPGFIAGVVPFDDKSTFPGLDRLDGRYVQITGVLDGEQLITLTDPDQIKVAG